MLKHKDYFDKYAEMLQRHRGAHKAWKETEKAFESEYGLRRFRTYKSFMDAHCRYRNGEKPVRIVLHICEIKI